MISLGNLVILSILIAITFFIIGIMISNLDDIKRSQERKKKIKKYNKLLNGVPKRVVFLTCWDDLWEYRDYPIYVDGQVLGVRSFEYWHVTDEYKTLHDRDGKIVGDIVTQIVRSERLARDRWKHFKSLAITSKNGFLGKNIKPSAIIEIY